MRYLSIYTHEPLPEGPTPEHIAKMGALIEEGMKAGWLIATEGVSGPQKGLRRPADPAPCDPDAPLRPPGPH